jgi:hypothetical protein
MDLVRVVKLEVDILDYERPDVVAETVGVKVTLQRQRISLRVLYCHYAPSSHLERQASLDPISQPVRNCFVEVYENLHGKLGLDSALGDQVVERVGEGTAQTVLCQPVHSKSFPRWRMQYLLRRYSS